MAKDAVVRGAGAGGGGAGGGAAGRPPPPPTAAAPPEANELRRLSTWTDPVSLNLEKNLLPQLRATGSSREEIKRNSPAGAGLF